MKVTCAPELGKFSPGLDSSLALASALALAFLWQLVLTPQNLSARLVYVLLAISGSLLVWEGWRRYSPKFKSSLSRQQVEGKTQTSKQPLPELTKEWHITRSDLEFFQERVEGAASVGGGWEVMLDKEIPNQIKYKAWRRFTEDGKTEYKTQTICHDVTADEFMDFYLDNASRPSWDTMIIENEILEQGNFSNREMVYRWVRKFPFSFLSCREYIIGRRLFRIAPENPGECDTLYDITKGLSDPSFKKAHDQKMVHVDEFYSMGSARTIECPWGSGKPATESMLLHHEQLKIPENLARFAVKHGMWTFVNKMSEEMPAWVAARRRRCSSTEIDPQAYGSPLGRNSLTSGPEMHASSSGTAPAAQSAAENNRNSFRGVAAFAAASALAVMMHRSASNYNVRKSREPSSYREVPEGGPRRRQGGAGGSKHNRYARQVSGF